MDRVLVAAAVLVGLPLLFLAGRWAWGRLFGRWYATGWYGRVGPYLSRQSAENVKAGRAMDPVWQGVSDGPIEYRQGLLRKNPPH
jgi:hypothetical protein